MSTRLLVGLISIMLRVRKEETAVETMYGHYTVAYPLVRMLIIPKTHVSIMLNFHYTEFGLMSTKPSITSKYFFHYTEGSLGQILYNDGINCDSVIVSEYSEQCPQ